MKGIVLYSSVTGNTKRLAEKIHEGIRDTGEWAIADIKSSYDASDVDVVLFGGWAEGGSFNKAALVAFEQLDKNGKRIGLFMTMGSRTSTDHGKMCAANLQKLAEDIDCLGIQTLQGYVAPALMEKLKSLPESAMPQSVKYAMEDGVKSYTEPTQTQYDAIVEAFKAKL